MKRYLKRNFINFNKELWNKTSEFIKTHPEKFYWEKTRHGNCGTVGCIIFHICKIASNEETPKEDGATIEKAAIFLGFKENDKIFRDFMDRVFLGFYVRPDDN